jgi:hypothetical protein
MANQNTQQPKTIVPIVTRFIDKKTEEKLNFIIALRGSSEVKKRAIEKVLEDSGVKFRVLGSGTNRIGIQFGMFAFKIALDDEGRIDNVHEFCYFPRLRPYVVNVYEINKYGTILVTEYVDVITTEEFSKHKNIIQQSEELVLKEVGSKFLLGDVGITTKNCNNWGKRIDRAGEKNYVILDFAYIYEYRDIKGCPRCGRKNSLFPTKNGTEAACMDCNYSYKFAELARLLTSKDQAILDGESPMPDNVMTLSSKDGETTEIL